MANDAANRFNIAKFGKKAMLSIAGAAVVTAPVVVGPIVVAMMGAAELRAQSPPPPQSKQRVAFEAASVKRNASGDGRQFHFDTLPGGRLSIKNVPLFVTIAWAYNVPFQGAGSRLSGHTQNPMFTESYDIEAVAEKSAIANDKTVKERDDTIRAMLRTLLAERFHLVIRSETKEVPVYAAVIGKNGPKLEKSKIDEKNCPETSSGDVADCHSFRGGMGRGLHGAAVDMSDLVGFVANWSDRPIVDRTGLHGLYNIQTDGWSPMQPREGGDTGAAEDGVPWSERQTLFTIFEKLGLKLEAQKAPVEIFVIVSAEKPGEN